MTLHSPTENSLAVLNHKILEANSQVQNEKLGSHQTCLSINRLWHELCDICAVLLEPQLLDIMIVQFRNEKVSNHGSIPITIDCNVVAFVVFEEGFHQPIKRTKQSVFLDVTVFDIHLWISFTLNVAVLFVDVAIQPEVRFIAKQNSLMKIGNNSHLVLGPFDESTPCLMIVLMNCQTKLRINHLTAVKSVAVLESNANLNFYTWKKKHSLLKL
ncbi:alpha-2 adrenergic receptor [Trichonephila clavipes]|nr:alpha-2 adrenergic receptor [Trichonephila clavipes]